MCWAFPNSEYYDGSAPPRTDRPTMNPAQPATLDTSRWAGPGDGSRVHCCSLDEGGARLCPSSLATSTPQTFLTASRSPASRLPEVPHHPTRGDGYALLPTRIHQIGVGKA